MADPDDVLLHEADLMTALLEAASPDVELLPAAEAGLRHWLGEAGEDPAKVDWKEVHERLRAALVELLAARALEPVTASRYRITARGRELLRHRSEGIDESLLARFPEYRRWAESRRVDGEADPRHDAFLAGMQAFVEGLAPEDNPYPPDTADFLAWEAGWSVARDAVR